VVPLPEDVVHGMGHLHDQLEILKKYVKLVVLLGKVVSEAFNMSIAKMPQIVSANNVMFLPMYHPAYLRRTNNLGYITIASKLIHDMVGVNVQSN
jgi:uracil-DNA glycosylase